MRPLEAGLQHSFPGWGAGGAQGQDGVCVRSGQDQEVRLFPQDFSEKSASVRDLNLMRRLIREFSPAIGVPFS